MADIFFVITALLFFVLAWVFTKACDHL